MRSSWALFTFSRAGFVDVPSFGTVVTLSHTFLGLELSFSTRLTLGSSVDIREVSPGTFQAGLLSRLVLVETSTAGFALGSSFLVAEMTGWAQ